MTILTTLPAVETPSLIIREIAGRDWRAFSSFMTGTAYQRHIALKLRNEAEVKAFVARQVARQGDDRRNVFHVAAEDKTQRVAVGDGFIILGRNGLAEIGWGVSPDHWRRGYGTEIGRALLGLAFERVSAARVWAKIMSANGPSLKLAHRIGLKHDRSYADYPAGHGKFTAVDIYALRAGDYFDAPY